MPRGTSGRALDRCRRQLRRLQSKAVLAASWSQRVGVAGREGLSPRRKSRVRWHPRGSTGRAEVGRHEATRLFEDLCNSRTGKQPDRRRNHDRNRDRQSAQLCPAGRIHGELPASAIGSAPRRVPEAERLEEVIRLDFYHNQRCAGVAVRTSITARIVPTGMSETRQPARLPG